MGEFLRKFTSKDFEAYRSNLVSFIFQDYHLLDELTVWENVTLLLPDLLALDAAAMVVISFVASFLPILFLKKIKPVEIIKAKE